MKTKSVSEYDMTKQERRIVDNAIWCALILIDTTNFNKEQEKYLNNIANNYFYQKRNASDEK